MTRHELNDRRSKACRRTHAALATGAAVLCISAGSTAGAASAVGLPGPAPALMRANAVPELGPPNHPNYAPRPEAASTASVRPSADGLAPQLLLLSVSAAAGLGVAGVSWLNRPRIGN
jgi:hypothetical protein